MRVSSISIVSSSRRIMRRCEVPGGLTPRPNSGAILPSRPSTPTISSPSLIPARCAGEQYRTPDTLGWGRTTCGSTQPPSRCRSEPCRARRSPSNPKPFRDIHCLDLAASHEPACHHGLPAQTNPRSHPSGETSRLIHAPTVPPCRAAGRPGARADRRATRWDRSCSTVGPRSRPAVGSAGHR